MTKGSTYTFTHVTLRCLLGASEVCFTLDGGSLAPRVQAGKEKFAMRWFISLCVFSIYPPGPEFRCLIPSISGSLCLLYPIVSDVLRGPVKE